MITTPPYPFIQINQWAINPEAIAYYALYPATPGQVDPDTQEPLKDSLGVILTSGETLTFEGVEAHELYAALNRSSLSLSEEKQNLKTAIEKLRGFVASRAFVSTEFKDAYEALRLLGA